MMGYRMMRLTEVFDDTGVEMVVPGDVKPDQLACLAALPVGYREGDLYSLARPESSGLVPLDPERPVLDQIDEDVVRLVVVPTGTRV